MSRTILGARTVGTGLADGLVRRALTGEKATDGQWVDSGSARLVQRKASACRQDKWRREPTRSDGLIARLLPSSTRTQTRPASLQNSFCLARPLPSSVLFLPFPLSLLLLSLSSFLDPRPDPRPRFGSSRLVSTGVHSSPGAVVLISVLFECADEAGGRAIANQR